MRNLDVKVKKTKHESNQNFCQITDRQMVNKLILIAPKRMNIIGVQAYHINDQLSLETLIEIFFNAMSVLNNTGKSASW